MRIGIWGNYYYGNFGDDLMAISIANYIIKLGHTPLIYRFDEKLSLQYHIESEHNINSFVEKVDFCFIGGGGMLVGMNWVKRVLNPVYRKFEHDFYEFEKALMKFKKEVYPISIGGEDNGKINFSNYRKHFFSSSRVQNGTVRLKGDLIAMEKFGKKYSYYPDILFDTANHFIIKQIIKKKKDEKWIGLNLNSSDLMHNDWHLKLIQKAKADSRIKLFFIRTHLPSYNMTYEFTPITLGENIIIHQYTNPQETLNLLASLDMVISSKLHLGLSALVVGTPFFSYKGKGKTIALLNSLGAKSAILKGGFDFNDFFTNNCCAEKQNNLSIFDSSIIKDMILDSRNHYKYIDQIVEAKLKHSDDPRV